MGSAYADEAAEFLAGHLADLWEKGLEGLRGKFRPRKGLMQTPSFWTLTVTVSNTWRRVLQGSILIMMAMASLKERAG